MDYVDFVKAEASRSGIADRIVFSGRSRTADWSSAFAGARVFVSMSEQEGFGVPIVEAMAAGLPVIAYGAAAVPEIMGGAGILLRDKDPEIVAATVQAVRSDPAIRDRLIERQFVRVDQIRQFDVPSLLEQNHREGVGQRASVEVQVQGPFETSYSLAMLNRGWPVVSTGFLTERFRSMRPKGRVITNLIPLTCPRHPGPQSYSSDLVTFLIRTS